MTTPSGLPTGSEGERDLRAYRDLCVAEGRASDGLDVRGLHSAAEKIAKRLRAALAGSGEREPIPAWLREMAEQVRTQDNRITAHPIFAVQQRERTWGFDEDSASDFKWHNCDDDYREATKSEAAWLEALRDGCEDIPKGWHRAGYVDTWIFVTACFTEAAAEAYIEANRHNLTDPRVFAYSANRNAEWIRMREWLKVLASAPPEASEEPRIRKGHHKLSTEELEAAYAQAAADGVVDQPVPPVEPEGDER